MTEYETSAGTRRSKTFPRHWTGLDGDLTDEQRAGAILKNMRADAERRGDHAAAAAIEASADRAVEEVRRHGSIAAAMRATTSKSRPRSDARLALAEAMALYLPQR